MSAIKGVLREYALAVGTAAVLALCVRAFLIEAFHIPSDFMAPTLLPGDNIFVVKVGSDKVKAGDVIVFSFQSDPTKDYIKRVIGLPGDKIAIQDHVVTINGNPVSTQVAPGEYDETLGRHHYRVHWDLTVGTGNMEPVTVPGDHIFVLGDSRSKGQDSRVWGFLPLETVKGRAAAVWLSANGWQIRWPRVMKRVL